MRKQIYEINEKGFIIEIYVGTFDDNGKLLNPLGDFVTTDLPQPLTFYKPKWNGTKWVEGAKQEEIDELTKVEPSPPTTEQRVDELESVVNMIILGGI